VSVDSAGGQANDSSVDFALSADGRFVAFGSGASNLVPGDTNGAFDIFLRDRQAGTTERVSVSSGGEQLMPGAGGGPASFAPGVSADGRFVAFVSNGFNLVPGDFNGLDDAFVRDRAPVVGPGDRIRELIRAVAGLGLPHGIEQSLTAKLQQALAAAEDANPAVSPCAALGAFLEEVRAQTAKKLSDEVASRLRTAAQEIRTAAGCSRD
jgi:hypothetical protein